MDDKLTPADPKDLAGSIAFALRFEGRKRVHEANEYMAAIAADRIVRLCRDEEAASGRRRRARARL